MSDVFRRRERNLLDGNSAQFAGREDFLEAILASGEYCHMDDPVGQGDLHDDIFRAWLEEGQTACGFAQRMSGLAESNSATFLQPNREVLREVVSGVLRAFDENEPEIAQLIFPYVTAPTGLTGLINDLCSDGTWVLNISGRDDSGVFVSLEYHTPGRMVAAVALGFGPFDFLPFTRQGPFTALLLCLRSDTPEGRQQRTDGRIPVYVQDARMAGNAQVDVISAAETVQIKSNILNGEFVEAASKDVTFRLPEANFDQIIQK
ncbi:hypothetical protein ACFVVX_15895 [Kitasatospora sp. NPDC058170]|uniref:hypothetical protein n=1 Tax=Kitasatospora sp. NPDC058170 TaxID=3346364 RepID=UPI0036DCD50D